MTPEDFAISLALARFMGWWGGEVGEICAVQPGSRYTTSTSTGVIHILPDDWGLPYSWHPLDKPEQAVEIMAEVVHRGGWMDFVVQPGKTFAHAHLETGEVGEHKEDAGDATAWCRAVCLAVFQAIESAECAAEMERALAR